MISKKKALIGLIVVLVVSAISITLFLTAPQKVTVGVFQIGEHGTLDAITLGFVNQLKAEFGEKNVKIIKDTKPQSAYQDLSFTLTQDLVFKPQGVELVFVNSTMALEAVNKTGCDVPVVAGAITDFAAALGVSSLDSLPGRNITGTSDLASPEDQVAMMVEICAAIPELAGKEKITVGIIHNLDEAASNYEVKEVKRYLEQEGFEYKEYSVISDHHVGETVELAAEECDVIYLPFDHTIAQNAMDVMSVIKTAADNGKKIPVFTSNENICRQCGLVALSIDYYDIGVATAKMAAAILRGEADPAKMDIEYAQPQKKYNKAMAELLGISVPSDYKEIE